MPSLLLALPGIHRVRRGAETAMEAMAGELARLPGWDVTVMGAGEPLANRAYRYEKVECAPFSRFERRPSWPLFRTAAQWEEFAFSRAMRRQVGNRRWDVTVGCSWPWTHFFLRRIGDRHVFWTQNGDHMIAAGRAEYRRFNCDGLVCTNPAYFARHKDRWRSILLPNGVDPAVFRPAESSGDAPRDGLARTVLVVSALISSKRVDAAIRAVRQLEGVNLLVCGQGPEERRLDQIGREMLGERYQRMTLPREEMPGLYRRVDAVVHPCDVEPSANVWSEALSSGKVVVAHDMEVTRWVLGEHGVLVDATKDQALAEGIRLALERGHAGEQARHESARQRLAWGRIALDMSGFFKDVLGEPRVDQPGKEPVWQRLGVVVIGRNEGERLARCLKSLPQGGGHVVYVDSGSDDGSVKLARENGVEVVELEKGEAFTAARARNAGLNRLREIAYGVELVVFVDGDTELLPGFVQEAVRALDTDARVVGVAGRRRERNPSASLYNQLCEMEWNTPVGEVKALGGDAVYRVSALAKVGGFREDLIAGEEPEMCLRLRRGGGALRRIPVDMTRHDASMTTWGQWWRRQERAGHAYVEGWWIHRGASDGEAYRSGEVRSVILWGGCWPVMVAGMASGWGGWWWMLGVAVYAAQAGRVGWGRWMRGEGWRESGWYGMMTVGGKFAQLVGMMKFAWAKARGKRREIVEYKSPAGGEVAGA